MADLAVKVDAFWGFMPSSATGQKRWGSCASGAMTAEWESESGTEAAECFAAFGIVQPEEAGGEDA